MVVGAHGTIGGALARRLEARGSQVHTTARRALGAAGRTLRLDLAARVGDWPRIPRTDVAVLSAVVTSIAACAADAEATARVNVSGTIALAERMAEQGTFVIFLSSNQVFDGSRARRPRDDARCPISEYGRQKVAVEDAIGRLAPSACVVRLTKVVHPLWPLLQRWRQALAAGAAVAPLLGLTLAPVTLDGLLDFLETLIERRPPGTFHFSGDDDVPYADLAAALIRAAGADPRLLQPIAASTPPPGFEAIPHYTSLDMRLETDRLTDAPPSSREAIEEVARLVV